MIVGSYYLPWVKRGLPESRFNRFLPTCQVRVVRLYVRCASPRSSSPLPHPSPPSSSSPDLICQLLIAVVVAGPLLPALDGSGPCRTPTASARSLWASPDFNRQESERCGPRRTSTSESLTPVGLAGLQPARV